MAFRDFNIFKSNATGANGNKAGFTTEFQKTVKDAAKDATAAERAIAGLKGKDKTTLAGLDSKVKAAETALLKEAERTESGGFVMKDGADKVKFDKAIDTHTKAVETRRDYLTGNEIEINKAKAKLTGTQGEKVTEAVKKAEASASAPINAATGWAGRVRTQGFKSAATQGLNEMKVWEKGKANVTGFARIGAVGVGATMAMDGIFRSKTSDGQDRSALTRLGEVVVGGGVTAAGVLTGRAMR